MLGFRLCTVNKTPDIFGECSTVTVCVSPRKKKAAFTWQNEGFGQVEVKQAGREVKHWMVSAKMDQRNFNTASVLARHYAHGLLDGYDAL